jgi:hypothetical protein
VQVHGVVPALASIRSVCGQPRPLIASALRYLVESTGSPQMLITKIRSSVRAPGSSTTNAPTIVSRSRSS